MSTMILIAFFAGLGWVIIQFGIEPALAVGTVVSGITWLIYRLLKGKQEVSELPGYIEYARSFFPIFLAVLPIIRTQGSAFPLGKIVVLLAAMLVCGAVWIRLAISRTVNTNYLETLRNE